MLVITIFGYRVGGFRIEMKEETKEGVCLVSGFGRVAEGSRVAMTRLMFPSISICFFQ